MNPIDVVIVDDSPICRSRLRAIAESDDDIRVVAELHRGRNVVQMLQRTRPAVLVTDLFMPEMDGLQVVHQVMRDHPLPIIVVSGGTVDELSAFDATRFGALEVAAKPPHGDHLAEAALRDAIRRVATIPVIRHPGSRITTDRPASPGRCTGASSRPPHPPERSAVQPRPEPLSSGRTTPSPPSSSRPTCPGPAPKVLGVGASAGGPPAVAGLLEALSPETPLTVLVAQHMPRNHAAAFARFLGRRCGLEVVVCRGPTRFRPSLVLVPDDGCDLVATGPNRATSVSAPRLLTPSVDVLLTSLAEQVGSEAAGVVLSGIGNDGAAGLAALRARGGLTLAQDEASSPVFGMPKAAAASAQFHLAPRELARVLAEAAARHRQTS